MHHARRLPRAARHGIAIRRQAPPPPRIPPNDTLHIMHNDCRDKWEHCAFSASQKCPRAFALAAGAEVGVCAGDAKWWINHCPLTCGLCSANTADTTRFASLLLAPTLPRLPARATSIFCWSVVMPYTRKNCCHSSCLPCSPLATDMQYIPTNHGLQAAIALCLQLTVACVSARRSAGEARR